MVKHNKCPNQFHRDGAKGDSYFEISSDRSKEGYANLSVGHLCVVVYDAEIPITWLAEIVAIASEHKGGIAGFLREHRWSGDSYALLCDPELKEESK